jgi:acetylornithine deacetylase/succinyl-diaminopimelate desuccinylase family protein
MTAVAGGLHDLIDTDRLVARLVEMVQIPSVNPFGAALGPDEGEQAMADYLIAHLDRLGYETGSHAPVEARPNAWGVSPGGDGPVLALAGHLDTVGVVGYDDPFSGEVRDGRVYGRGTCDMKAAFAAFLEVADVLAESGRELSGRLAILGLCDEEAAMWGSANYVGNGPKVDMVIVGEPTNLDVCRAHLGQYAFVLRTRGEAVHSSIAETGVNAIEHMTKVIGVLDEYRAEVVSAEPHPLCGTGKVCPSVIRGGDMVSTVPDVCELEVDRRMAPGETADQVDAALGARLDALAATVPNFDWELAGVLVNSAPLDTPAGAPLVQAALAANSARSLNGESVKFAGSTDAPHLGVPAVIWGPGGLSEAHTLDEWVDIEEAVTAAHLYLDAVLCLIA